MECDSEIDVIVAVALKRFAPHPESHQELKLANKELAIKRFQKEFPTPESQWAYVDSFLRRNASDFLKRLEDRKKVAAALGFWFEVIWPNLPIRGSRLQLANCIGGRNEGRIISK